MVKYQQNYFNLTTGALTKAIDIKKKTEVRSGSLNSVTSLTIVVGEYFEKMICSLIY